LSSSKRIALMEDAAIFPANLYLAPKDMIQEVMNDIQDEMMEQSKLL
jgi:excinuclease ABC subunit B